jgi:23S rRNA (cytosine1962-C5)-methyltransferase
MIWVMSLITKPAQAPISLRLSRNLTRAIKRGHPWVYAEALRRLPPVKAGSQAILYDNQKNRPIACGFFDPHSPLAFRVCTTQVDEQLDDRWAQRQFLRALSLRQMLFGSHTTGYRLFNGEGDGLPGLVCDVYHDTAVLQLDGAGPSGFWNVVGIARWLAETLPLRQIYLKPQSRQSGQGEALIGSRPGAPIEFLENSVRFNVDVVHGQKTGFFLDQRDNRQHIRTVAAGRRALNLFGYTGGFSVYAGLGGASHVTTVDLAAPALKLAEQNWRLNNLPADQHTAIRADAFDFLENSAKKSEPWDLVVVDPPSFASTQEAVAGAQTAYRRLIAAGAKVARPDGLLAAASCSSHIDVSQFLSLCEEGISLAQRRATVLNLSGQPADHPSPLPFGEFRYLKFVLVRVE